jgi:cyanophycinase
MASAMDSGILVEHSLTLRITIMMLCTSLTRILLIGSLIAIANAPVWAGDATDKGTPLTKVGPARGTLFIHGGGGLGKSLIERFIELAGGPDALIIIVPTAGEENEFPDDWQGFKMFKNAGATNLKVLHTRDPEEADSQKFVRPLEEAGGVWLGGGRQWRLADAYLKTRTLRAMSGVLERGGVIGGSSAGATIQGSYMVRGAPEGNHIMMAPGHEVGFGFLRNTAIDQHLITRKREEDMLPVVKKYPELLGIGIDEGTAVLVQRDEFEVVGSSKVAIYNSEAPAEKGDKEYFFLEAGERFNLATRKVEKAETKK